MLQSGGYDPTRVAALRDYVWSRPVGEPAQEVGGVMLTLAAYCNAHDLDLIDASETELASVWTKVDIIRAEQAAKPSGSALPQVWPLEAPAPYAWICKDLVGHGVSKLVFDADQSARDDAEMCGPWKAWEVTPVYTELPAAGCPQGNTDPAAFNQHNRGNAA